MELRSADRPAWPLGLILKTGVLNAVLVTVLSAIAMALLAGSGTSDPFPSATPVGPHFWSRLPNPVEVAKAVVLLCPITAVTGGSFGLLGGIALSALMFAGRWHANSTARLLVKLALASFLFAILFQFVTRWIAGAPPPVLMLLGYFLALLGAFPLSGLLFRRRLCASRQSG